MLILQCIKTNKLLFLDGVNACCLNLILQAEVTTKNSSRIKFQIRCRSVRNLFSDLSYGHHSVLVLKANERVQIDLQYISDFLKIIYIFYF